MTLMPSPSSVFKPTSTAPSSTIGPVAKPAPPHGAESVAPQTTASSPSPFPSLNLRGTLDPLAALTHRLLDFHDNRLNGTVSPILSNCTNLKLLYLAGNDLSGEILLEIASVKGLLRLDLSDNSLHGTIPKEVSQLHNLLTLRLQNNVLTGFIPDLSASMVNLEELNMTNNEFYGRLPETMLKKFGDESFSGNEGL